jgi:hypothetical protein
MEHFGGQANRENSCHSALDVPFRQRYELKAASQLSKSAKYSQNYSNSLTKYHGNKRDTNLGGNWRRA